MTRYSRVIESDAEDELIGGVKRNGGMSFKLKFIGIAGAPDRLILMPGGRFYFVEVKKDDGALEPSQRALFPLIERLGFKIHVLYGVEQVKQFIIENLKEVKHE